MKVPKVISISKIHHLSGIHFACNPRGGSLKNKLSYYPLFIFFIQYFQYIYS